MRRTNNARRGLGIRGQLMFFLCFICLFLLVLFWILSTQLLEPLYTRHIERQLDTLELSLTDAKRNKDLNWTTPWPRAPLFLPGPSDGCMSTPAFLTSWP
jgi:hypothetical protein